MSTAEKSISSYEQLALELQCLVIDSLIDNEDCRESSTVMSLHNTSHHTRRLLEDYKYPFSRAKSISELFADSPHLSEDPTTLSLDQLKSMTEAAFSRRGTLLLQLRGEDIAQMSRLCERSDELGYVLLPEVTAVHLVYTGGTLARAGTGASLFGTAIRLDALHIRKSNEQATFGMRSRIQKQLWNKRGSLRVVTWEAEYPRWDTLRRNQLARTSERSGSNGQSL